MAEIEYTETDERGLDLTNELWLKLLRHHAGRSRHFSERVSKRTIEDRRKELSAKTKKGRLHIGLAKDKDTGELVGYCISSVNKEKMGEIESIFIEESYRGNSIGDGLMKRALSWMDSIPVKRVIAAVLYGNEEVFPFYQKYNILPRATVLEQIKEETDRL